MEQLLELRPWQKFKTSFKAKGVQTILGPILYYSNDVDSAVTNHQVQEAIYKWYNFMVDEEDIKQARKFYGKKEMNQVELKK